MQVGKKKMRLQNVKENDNDNDKLIYDFCEINDYTTQYGI